MCKTLSTIASKLTPSSTLPLDTLPLLDWWRLYSDLPVPPFRVFEQHRPCFFCPSKVPCKTQIPSLLFFLPSIFLPLSLGLFPLLMQTFKKYFGVAISGVETFRLDFFSRPACPLYFFPEAADCRGDLGTHEHHALPPQLRSLIWDRGHKFWKQGEQGWNMGAAGPMASHVPLPSFLIPVFPPIKLRS